MNFHARSIYSPQATGSYQRLEPLPANFTVRNNTAAEEVKRVWENGDAKYEGILANIPNEDETVHWSDERFMILNQRETWCQKLWRKITGIFGHKKQD